MLRASSFVVALLLVVAQPSSALLFFSSGDPSKNTTAPTGPLAGSGWQYQGQWGSVTGTPIAPRHFISAAHINGMVGSTFIYQGVTYTTVAKFDDPDGDLQIWEVDKTFPTYAPLYTGSDEVGKDVVFFGRGGPRGSEVTLSSQSKGWLWTDPDAILRWGENTIVANLDGGSYGHNLLALEFNNDAGPNEAGFSAGDSGGGLFINDGGTWKLAGVNSYADGPYGPNSTPFDQQFSASLFDTEGYYGDTLNGWEDVSGPGLIYVSRISSSQAWISSIAAVPEPTSGAFVVAALAGLAAYRRRFRKAS